MLGIEITGLKEEINNEITEFDIKQLACELSMSRYVSPRNRVILIAIKVLLGKILKSDLISNGTKLKATIFKYYNIFNSYLSRK